jgi:hypothetical protein
VAGAIAGFRNDIGVGACEATPGSVGEALNKKILQKSSPAFCSIKQGQPRQRNAMLARRTLVLTGLIGMLAANDERAARAEPPSTNDPVAIVTAIYTRAAKGKGDSGGGFVIESKAAKAKYLSRSLIELWAKADAHTPKGDVGPVDFDPVTNSQDPDVKSFKVEAEKLETDKAVIAVTITGRNTPPRKGADQVVRYAFVHEGDKWKIDDIKGASDGEPWSIRAMLEDSLKG